MTMRLHAAGALLAFALVGCGGAEEAAESRTGAADSVAGTAAGMEGMNGMQGMGDDGMAQMQAHMRMMQGAGGDSLRAMLPMHRQMAANMLARMNREMRDMNMPGDAAWNATVDSLRQDLTRMPEMDAAEFQAAMPAHRSRLERLMEMHRAMMANMGM